MAKMNLPEIELNINEIINKQRLSEEEEVELKSLSKINDRISIQIESIENVYVDNRLKKLSDLDRDELDILYSKKIPTDKRISELNLKSSFTEFENKRFNKLIQAKEKLIQQRIYNSYSEDMSNEDKFKFKILTDFKFFLKIAFKEIMDVEPTPLQEEIADFLNSEHRYRMIQAYRGVGKTYITAAYIVWRFLRDVNYTVLVVSASQDFAVEVGRFVRTIINDLPFTKHLIPSKDDLDNAKQFNIPGRTISNKVPSVKMGSIIGGITGSRAFEILADDVETSNNSETQLKRDNLKNKIKELESILMPGGRITYLGTPQTQESLYTDLKEGGYEVRIWTALYPEPNKLVKYGKFLAPSIRRVVEEQPNRCGTATNPKMHDTEDLIGREARVGKSYFALQFMLDTTLSDELRYPLKTKDLIIFHCNEDKAPMTMNWGNNDNLLCNYRNRGLDGDNFYQPFFIDEVYKEYEMSVMAVDPSGKGDDETAYTIAKYLNGYIYIIKVGGVKGGYTPESLLRLAQIAKKYKVNKIITEENYGGGMFNQLFSGVLNRIYPVEVEDQWTNKQKELRIINTLEPVMNSHKLVFNVDVIEEDNRIETINYSLIYQMTRIEKKRDCLIHDDKLDSLAAAVEYFVEGMGVDSELNTKDYRKDLAETQWLKQIGMTLEDYHEEIGYGKSVDDDLDEGYNGYCR